MLLSISCAPGLEDQHPFWLLFGFGFHDRLFTLFHHIPEFLFSSHHCHSSGCRGISHSSLSKSSMQNVMDFSKKDRFGQRQEGLPCLSCIGPSYPRTLH